MTPFTQFLSRFYPGQPAFWWVMSSGLLLVLFFVGRRQWRVHRRVVAANAAAANPESLLSVDNWLPHELQPGDRRNSLRRTGTLVRVKVIDPKKPESKIAGIVVDRSMTGLRVALPSSLAIGSTVQIRADSAHPDSPWTPIIVRNCAHVDDCFEHGCQFETQLPLVQLLSFG
jgi:PilZ domain